MRWGWLGVIAAVALAVALAVTARAVEILPLAEAARRVGEEVRFVDSVKGVSRSPNSGALYLNFGDAYPRQVLSLRIEPGSRELADGFADLLGCTVEVTGRVKATPTGPIVPVTSADQLKVLPPETAGALTEAGEGAAFRRRFAQAVRDRFEAGDYAGLEALATDWGGTRARFGDGGWKLVAFYGALATRRSADEATWTRNRERVDAWRRKFPQSVTAAIVEANQWTDYAWKARGSGWASTVTDDGWRRFWERLKLAREALDGVDPAGRRLPGWGSAMLTVALGQQWDRARTQALLEAARADEPEFYQTYFRYAYYLLPRWHGEPGEWEDFAADMERAHPGSLGHEIYARIVMSQADLFGNVFAETTVSWPRMKEGFDAMRRRWPDSVTILSNYAYYAAMARDRETALRLLDELGDRVDMERWVSWENVDLARRWLTDDTGKAPTPYVFRRADGN